METGNPESQTPLCVDVGVRERGWQPRASGLLAPSGPPALQGPEEDARDPGLEKTRAREAGLPPWFRAAEKGLGWAAGGAGCG